MRILYFGYPSGSGKAPHQEMAAIHLARQGYSVDHICWGGKADDHSFEVNNLVYLPQPKKGILSAFSLLLRLVRILSLQREYDVIYVQGAQQTPFLFWLPFIRRKIRIVYHTQDYLEPGRHRFYERFERRLARNAHYVISNEVNRARFLKSHYGLAEMPIVLRTALPEWWPIPERSDELRREILSQSEVADPERAVVIVSGGPYRADRMSSQLVEAFARLPENYVLVFNGPAMEPGRECRAACEQKMKELGIAERIVFRGGLSFKQLLALYSIGEIGVLLYPNEGIGHFYQCPGRFSEYLRGGLSLISSDFPGLELLTIKYNLGAVCDPEAPESIATAIQRVGELAKNRRAGIIELSEKEFVYERGAKVLIDILEGAYEHK
ncbi:glycosyltransferase family 4 protein [Pontiellaceae bacterium B12227]|nr:glycosyltransferase family 4 protein [Pontiellaceae bacterium B12227]